VDWTPGLCRHRFHQNPAKIANHVAKKRPQYGGVFDLEALSPQAQTALLSGISVGEVWGVGRRIETRLGALGISTVANLRDARKARSVPTSALYWSAPSASSMAKPAWPWMS